MKRVKEHGRPFWRYFWGRGGQESLPELDERAARAHADRSEPTRRRNRLAIASQIVAALIGAYLMAAPAIWDYDNSAASNVDRFIGPLIASFATIAVWECTRGVRWLNLPLAVALAVLAISPWPWYYPRDGMISACICAAAVVVLTLVPYPQVGSYGGGWSRLWRTPKAHVGR
jgi:peptidoglycan/LPS O-acetylase OafA/YrhL